MRQWLVTQIMTKQVIQEATALDHWTRAIFSFFSFSKFFLCYVDLKCKTASYFSSEMGLFRNSRIAIWEGQANHREVLRSKERSITLRRKGGNWEGLVWMKVCWRKWEFRVWSFLIGWVVVFSYWLSLFLCKEKFFLPLREWWSRHLLVWKSRCCLFCW